MKSAAVRILLLLLGVTAAIAAAPAPGARATGIQTTDTVVIRGRPQTVHVYGSRGTGDPVIVSSGDGGWIHLGPRVAEMLAARGFFVVGFDSRAYLESFTTASTTLRLEDEPDDFGTLARYAARGSAVEPILIGVSEGAGLSLLAATDANVRQAIGGVIALG